MTTQERNWNRKKSYSSFISHRRESDTSVIGTTNPAALLNAIFFYYGKNFCLRGSVEHRGLKLTQVQREPSVISGKKVNGYVYTEHGS